MSMNDERAKRVAFSVLLSLSSLSIGFGVSQITLAGEVHVATANVAHHERSIVELRQADKDYTDRLEARFSKMADLQAEQIRQATELIALIKVQNQIKAGTP